MVAMMKLLIAVVAIARAPVATVVCWLVCELIVQLVVTVIVTRPRIAAERLMQTVVVKRNPLKRPPKYRTHLRPSKFQRSIVNPYDGLLRLARSPFFLLRSQAAMEQNR